MSNVMAVDAATDLDAVENIEMSWLVGHERPDVGRAVLEHMLHIATGGTGLRNPQGWKYALSGMRAQIRRGESPSGLLWKFLGVSALRRTFPYKGGLLAPVHGTEDGKPATATRRTALEPDSALNNMAGVTGTACAAFAAFAVLALDEAGQRAGAFAPEDWADPQLFYKALERVGVPREQIVESL